MRRLLVALIVLAVLGGAVFWLVTQPATVAASALAAYTPNLENGKTIFYAGGCASCHATPGQEDKTRLGGGVELKSPYGSFFAPNISSDPKDGIGGWTDQQIKDALTKGVRPDGSQLASPMPWRYLASLRDEDVDAIVAYLRTLKPIAD